MEITPLIPDGYEGAIKRLECILCKRQFYVTREYFETHQPTHCYECSELFAPKKPKREPLVMTVLSGTEEELHAEGFNCFFKWPHRALIIFQKASERFPENANNHFYCAMLLYRLKEYSQAIEACNAAINHDPSLATAYSLHGDCLHKLASYHQAHLFYDKAIELDPSETSAYLGKGDVFCSLTDFDAAFLWYEKAISLFPNDFEAYERKIQLLLLLQKEDEAESIYTTFLAAYPDDFKACQLYAIFLARRERTQEYLQMKMRAWDLRKSKKRR